MKIQTSILATILVAATLSLAPAVGHAAESAPTYGVATLIQEPSKPWDKPIVLEGFVTAVCPRSGKKAWLHDTNPDTAGSVRVERIGSIPVFEKDVVGKTIRVTGILRELRIDAAYLDSWESRVKGSNTVVEKKDNCTEKCEVNDNVDTALKRIAALRSKLAGSKDGYLSQFWVDGTQWELAEAKGVN